MRRVWVLLVIAGCLGRGADDEDRNPCATVVPCTNDGTITAATGLTGDELERKTITLCQNGTRCGHGTFSASCADGCVVDGDLYANVQMTSAGVLAVHLIPTYPLVDGDVWSLDVTDDANASLFSSSKAVAYGQIVALCGTCTSLTVELP